MFDVREHLVKTGSNKGKMEKKVGLTIGNHTFKRRRKMGNGNYIFTCNGCDKIGHYLSAVVGVEDEESGKYYVIRAPTNKDHLCWVSAFQQVIKRARDQMCEMVLKEPTRSLLEIYEEVRRDCTEDLDSVTKLIFLQDFPSYTEIKTILSRKRREVIPADPKSMTDIDLSLPVFLYKDGESVVKGEQVLSDGRRIILFTTKEHLKILARARQILGDGTFRITPSLWCQTFIISAEVSKDVFVPVAFCLLPDKKKESYVCMFTLLKNALEDEGLELSAEYFMTDFEVAIRDSFLSTFTSIQPPSQILVKNMKIQELEKKMHKMFVRKIKFRELKNKFEKNKTEQDEKIRDLEIEMKKNKTEQAEKIRNLEIDMKKHKTEQDVKMRELEIDMKKYKTENNNMMKVIQRLESENQKNQARNIDLEEEVRKIFCEKEEC